jgi:CubicO group peptidase (beta-lactamase class C family)
VRARAAAALLSSLGTLAAGAPAAAQGPRAPAVDRVFAAWDRPDSPGCAVGVVRDGRMVYQRGYGAANLDYDVPNGPDVVYYVGSISKQFTAAAVALLAIRGRLSLDDDVRAHFPELRDYGAPITVRHLVHHTSGIRDVYALMDLRGDRMENVYPDSAALGLIARQRGLAFAPGTAYSYSNSGYFLLGQLVRRVTGKPLRQFADEEIFRPLGMTRTHFHDDPGHVIKRPAIGYQQEPGGAYRVAHLQNFDKAGAGGLYTTLDDLRKWDDNFYTRKVGGDALHALLHTRGVLANGDTLTYAFGNTVHAVGGLRAVEHSGSLMGYKAHLLRFPDERLTTIVTCNLGAIDPAPLAHRVAEHYLGPKLAVVPTSTATRRPAATTPAPPPAPSGPPRAGAYYSDDLDATFRVTDVTADGAAQPVAPSLVFPTGRAVRIAANGGEYRAGTAALRFVADTMVMRVSRVGELRLVRR